MNTFFICSTPRSRTAWLSNFLTSGDSFCFHELLAECADFKDMRVKFENVGKGTVGNSDSGNPLFIKQIKKEFPESKIVVIKRDVDDVMGALMKCGLGFEKSEEATWSILSKVMAGIEEIENNYDCLTYGYKSLESEGCCRRIYEYCTGQSFDWRRWKMLTNLNIQVNTIYEVGKIKAISEEILNLIEN